MQRQTLIRLRAATGVAAMAAVLALRGLAAGAEEGRPVLHAPREAAYFLRPGDVVLFLGNSITQAAQMEMDFLTEDFRKQYPALADGDGKVNLILSGIGGEQAFNGAKRLKALLEAHKPTVCVVGYGTCEVTFKNQQSFMPAMKDIVGQLKKAGVAVTIVSAPPPSIENWHQPSYPVEPFVSGIPVMVAQARKVAAEEHVLFVDNFAAFKAAGEQGGRELTPDGIHPNRDGYRVMADALQRAWGFGKPLAEPAAPR